MLSSGNSRFFEISKVRAFGSKEGRLFSDAIGMGIVMHT